MPGTKRKENLKMKKQKYYLLYQTPYDLGIQFHQFYDRYNLEVRLLNLKNKYRGNKEFAYYVICGFDIKFKNVNFIEYEGSDLDV